MRAKERIRAAIPTRELQRRWSAARQAMKAAGIDPLSSKMTTSTSGAMSGILSTFRPSRPIPSA